MTTVAFILLAGHVALTLFVYHKLSSAVDSLRWQVKRDVDNCISQVEGLMAVYSELRSENALPRSRGWAASPDFLALLLSLARNSDGGDVIECGSGLSTIVLATCMRNRRRGHVYTLEHDRHYAEQSRKTLQAHGLGDWATVVDAPLEVLTLDGWAGRWYSLDALPVDVRASLLVVDGPPEATGTLARYPALPMLEGRLAERCTVAVDDADRPDETELVRLRSGQRREFRSVEGARCEKGAAVLRRG